MSGLAHNTQASTHTHLIWSWQEGAEKYTDGSVLARAQWGIAKMRARAARKKARSMTIRPGFFGAAVKMAEDALLYLQTYQQVRCPAV